MKGALDTDALRADTPGTRERIHLNNAGASLQPAPVLAAVREHLELEARIGGYEAADARSDAIGAAYAAVAGLVGARTRNVALTEHATASFVQALSAVPFRAGDVILTTRNDYVSNQLQYLSLRERLGVEVVRAPDRPEGGVDPDAMAALMDRHDPRLVALTHVPTSSGLVQDAAEVGAACRRRDLLYLVDACQSVGQLPVDVEELGCDFLSATGRKYLRGTRGTGFLVVSDRALDEGLIPLFPDLRGADWVTENGFRPRSDARRFETWETSWALALGLGAAARYASEVGVERIADRASALAGRLRSEASGIPGVRALDRGTRLSAIVTLHVEGRDPADLVRRLRERGINTSSVDRSSALLDLDEKGVEGALRVSPHYYNTGAELEAFLEALRELAAG